ncbi:MAG TPA: HepT-like ribonuclease domain-containing protein [Methylomirabilota bacterium]
MVAENLERLARAHGIRLLLQFGSTVTGLVHERSDVDLAVLLERPELSLDAHARLVHDLQSLFPERPIDLTVVNHADPLFLKQVVERCRLLYGTATELRHLQLLAFKRYQDHRKYLDLERRFVAGVLTGAAPRGDRDVVTRKLAMILDDLRAVTPIAQKSLDDYLGGATDEILAERYLERMIGRMIDINYHLITDAGHAPPRDYYESFTQLAKLGIMPAEFALQIAACAGLRNRLVHEYDEIDPRRVHEGLQAAVRDIPEHLRHVYRRLEGGGP